MASPVPKVRDVLAGLSPRQREAVLFSLAHPAAPRRREAGRKAHGGRRVVCPYCGSVLCSVRTGCKKGRQRYRCKTTGRYFSSTTGKVFQRSHKPLSVWRKFVECLAGGLSLAKCAEACAISVPTAFAWRHKVLDALRLKASRRKLAGDIEVRSTCLNLSYAGNHVRSRSGFKMPRPPHKRGVKGVSAGEERVCVLDARGEAARGRRGGGFSEGGRAGKGARVSVSLFVCMGPATREAVEAALRNQVAAGSALRAGRSAGPQGGKASADDPLSELRGFLKSFHGVATKHLVNYLASFDLLREAGDDPAWAARALFACLVKIRCYTRRGDISLRPPVPTSVAGRGGGGKSALSPPARA